MSRMLLALIVVGAMLSCRGEGEHTAMAGSPAPITHEIGPRPGMPDSATTAVSNPYHDDATALLEGRRLFVWYNCAGCHGSHGGGGMGPSLRDSLWYYGSGDAQLFASIAEGRQKGMPAWGTQLPRDQIWRIVAYIKAMRTPGEPDAPAKKL